MRPRFAIYRAFLVLGLSMNLAAWLAPSFAVALPEAPNTFTYQGRLKESGNPVTGLRCVMIEFFNAETSGALQGSTSQQSVSVQNGLFRSTFTVPSGLNLDTAPLYVRINAGTGTPPTCTLTGLDPRELLTSSLFAVRATSAAYAQALNVGGPNAPGIFVSSNLFVTSGNLGIGTTKPDTYAYLQVKTGGSGNFDNITVESPSSAVGYGVVLKDTGGSTTIGRHTGNSNATFVIHDGSYRMITRASSPMELIREGASSADTVLQISSGISAGQELMVVRGGGNVGIGTTSPATRLHLSGGGLQVGDADAVTVSSVGYISLPKLVSQPPALKGRLFFDDAAPGGALKVSLDGSAFVALSTGGAGGGLGGSGTANRLPRFTAATTLGDSALYESAGNVGIGTTNPGRPLEVNGFVRSVSGYDIGTVTILSQVGSDLQVNNAAAPIRFAISGAEMARIAANGNVGIGTTEATGRLNIPADALSEIRFPPGSNNVEIESSNQMVLGTYGGGDVTLKSNTQERVRITSGGNVGIGTTSPGAVLHVSSPAAAGAPLLLVQNNVGPGAGRIGLRVDMSMADPGEALDVKTSATTRFVVRNDGNIGIATGVPQGLFDVGGGSFVVKTSGNVGIGTTSPTHRLHVKGPGTTSQQYLRIEDSGANSRAEVNSDIIGNSYIQMLDGGSTLNVVIHTGGNSYFNGGKVGIGTASPSTLFQVGAGTLAVTTAGNVGIGTTSPSGGRFHVAGGDMNLDANTWYRVGGTIAISGDGTNTVIDSAGSLLFRSGQVEKMRMTAAGNVGVGTTNPTERLMVDNTVGIVGRATIPSLAAGGNATIYYDNGGNQLRISRGGGLYMRFGYEPQIVDQSCGGDGCVTPAANCTDGRVIVAVAADSGPPANCTSVASTINQTKGGCLGATSCTHTDAQPPIGACIRILCM